MLRVKSMEMIKQEQILYKLQKLKIKDLSCPSQLPLPVLRVFSDFSSHNCNRYQASLFHREGTEKVQS